MTELVGTWLHFTPRQAKRKRAELVCTFCHSKKVKCDLQIRSDKGDTKCSNCETQDRECHIRPSKRGKQRRRGQSPDSLRADLEGPSPTSNDGASPSAQLISHISIHDAASQLTSIPNTAPSLGIAAANGDTNPQLPLTTPSALSEPSFPPRSIVHAHHAHSHASPDEVASRGNAGDIDTGFLQVYGPESRFDAEQQEFVASLGTGTHEPDSRQQELQQSFAETYFEYCYPWCPVLDANTLAQDLARSPMLANSLSLAASHIRPPLVPHQGTEAYYNNAKRLFYDDEEPDAIATLRSLSLFYWWAPRPPSTAHRHSSWWWTSVIIRHAQQIKLHREPADNHPLRDKLNLGLRRRIWWTAFARERLTALCQSKPCIIDPEDCTIEEPQLADFPSDPAFQHKGRIFIYWVRLCRIIGRIAQYLSRASTSEAFPADLKLELVEWVATLPPDLQLPIQSAHTEAKSFDKDVCQLHLPYLTTVIIIHLRKCDDLPQALPPAILAASCIARIMRDVLSRGDARFLMPITCWYCGIGFIPLLQACRIPQMAKEAEEGLEVLTHAVTQLQNMWGSANVIRQGFERLRKCRTSLSPDVSRQINPAASSGRSHPAIPHGCQILSSTESDSFDWTILFPFVTRNTNKIAECLVQNGQGGGGMTTNFPSPENALVHETLMNQYHNLLEPFIELPMDFSDISYLTM